MYIAKFYSYRFNACVFKVLVTRPTYVIATSEICGVTRIEGNVKLKL